MMVTVLYKKYLRTTSYLVEEMECSNDSDSSSAITTAFLRIKTTCMGIDIRIEYITFTTNRVEIQGHIYS